MWGSLLIPLVLAGALVPLGANSALAINTVTIVVVLLFAATTYRSDKIQNWPLVATAFALPLLILAQAMLAAVGTAAVPYETYRAVYFTAALACYFLLVHHMAASPRNLRFLLAGLVVITSLEAAYSVLNLLAGNERLLFYKRWAYPDSATGTLVNRNHFAYLMELGLPLTAAFTAIATMPLNRPADRSPNTPTERRAKRVLLSSLAVAVGLGLVFSRSRMGIVSLLAAAAAVLALNAISTARRGGGSHRKGQSRVGLWLLGLATAGYALVIGLDPVLERFFHIGSDLESGRWPIWQVAMEMFNERPIFGHGWGSFEYLAPAYREVPSGLYYTHAHSEYLEVAAEAGIAGLLLVAWMIFLFARRLLKTLTLPLTPLQRTTVVALGVAITSVLLHSATDFGLRIPGVALAFVYVVALFVRITDDPSLVDGLAISRQQAAG